MGNFKVAMEWEKCWDPKHFSSLQLFPSLQYKMKLYEEQQNDCWLGTKISASKPSLDQMRSYRVSGVWHKLGIGFVVTYFLLFIYSFRAQFEGTFKVKTKGDRKEKQSFAQEEGWKCQFIQEASFWGDGWVRMGKFCISCHSSQNSGCASELKLFAKWSEHLQYSASPWQFLLGLCLDI